MPADMRIEAEGVAKALRILGNLDKELAKEIKKELKAAATPVVKAAKQDVPTRPLSNWGSWTTPNNRDLSWDKRKVQAGLKVVSRTSKERVSFTDREGNARKKYTKQIALLQLRNESIPGHIYELAGSKSKSPFSQNLISRHGQPKRLLFKALEPQEPRIQRDVRATVDKIEREVTRRLAR